MKTFPIHFTDEQHEKIQKVAREKKTSIKALIFNAIKKYFK